MKWRGNWYYAIKDVVKALTDTPDTKGYIKDLRNRKPELKKNWTRLTRQSKLPTAMGEQYVRSAKANDLKKFMAFIPFREKEKEQFVELLDRVDSD